MKPQSLQDAIKAQALAKARKREGGGWKEPLVKQHKVTADDLKASPKVQSPMAAAPLCTAASAPMNSSEVTAIKNMMQMKLMPLVEGLSEELKQQKSAIFKLQEENKDLSNCLERQNHTISSLKQENRELKEMIQQQSTSIISALRADNNELKTLLKEQAKNSGAQMTAYPITPVATSKPKLSIPMSPYFSSPPASPSKKSKPPASLEPHDAQHLLASQRKDKTLRHFMKHKEGLFEPKYMSLREVSGGNLVLFKKKIYIPENLRSKTIQYYRAEYSDSEALEKMRKNCCWPDMETDFSESIGQ